MTPADKLEALPCPFCGGTPVIEPWHGGGPMKRHIGCQNEACPVEPGITGSTKSRAIAAWNTRAAIRAELGEAVPVAWCVTFPEGGTVLTSALHGEGVVPALRGGGWEITPLYTTPPASVPVEALRELAERWIPDESEEEETEFDRGYEQALDECKADLTARIAAQEKK